MTAARVPAVHLCLRVGLPAPGGLRAVPGPGSDVRHRHRYRPSSSLTLPEQIEAAHVDFARQLAAKAWAYSVAVERRYRGLPPLPDVPIPYTLTAEAEALLTYGPERAELVPLAGGREGTA